MIKRVKKEKSKAASYRDCIVTFIDILGFRNIVRERSPEEIQEIVNLVQRHAGSDEEELARKDGFDFDHDTPWTRTSFFSDSVVRVRPYDAEIHDGSLFHELLNLVHAQAELVNQGIFIRGGLTAGKLYLRDNVLFGPAMIQAYDLESKFANYPRIVIDPITIDALKTDARLRNEDHTPDEELKSVRKLLRRGDDGLHYVDYLYAFRDEMDEYEEFPAFLKRVKNHIVANATAASENLGILQKYLWAAKYLNQTAKRFEDCKDQDSIRINDHDIPALAEA
ncbi:hypothetical protein F1645_13600 [Novacetimonas hansenii]|uniref:Guanylate cyclase domain-containing protein n=2 Tax=Novacetimonas hansenii TaxID=436 RepID=A0ABQ0SIE9_NOVHA|nr:hypothetical protein [Novacetimonas hansenii]EFG85473.1 hypothetical protein GXY_03008 [Novacetimonas hansenii ATCC 23769]GAN83739.1 hypothetical protein Gaha_0101_009 [Novacetimonas hansenii JCM 7643]GBQ61483.1 hypothetical protein AA0243_2668 [Novacetimonas hansenii NRIC 0243]GEC65137.1 hypothetical protein GHA01_29860 [Novacetimonas hansenii]